MKSTDTHQHLLHTSCHLITPKSPYLSASHCEYAISVPPLKDFSKEPVNYWNFCVSRDTDDSTFKPKSTKPSIFHFVALCITSQRKNTDGPVFVTTCNPRLPHLNSIIQKYFPILTATNFGNEAFKDAPLIAYRRPKILRDFLVKAKLKWPSESNKTLQFIAHGSSSYTFHNTGEQRKIPQNLSCSSDYLKYLINCKRCIKQDPTLPCQYIGQTIRTLRERFGEHRRGIQNKTVPIHFNQPKHTLNDVQLTPILHINNNGGNIRLTME